MRLRECVFSDLGAADLPLFQKRLLFLAIVNKKSLASHFSLLAIAAILQNWASDKTYMFKCVLYEVVLKNTEIDSAELATCKTLLRTTILSSGR